MFLYYQNARSVVKDLDNFRTAILSDMFQIFAVSETWLDESIPSYFISIRFQIYRSDRNRQGGGLLFAVDGSLESSLVYSSDHLELICIRVRCNYEWIYFILIYLPPPVSLSDLTDFESEINFLLENYVRDHKWILVGDFNLTGFTPDSLSDSSRADSLVKYFSTMINSFGLRLLPGDPTRLGRYLDLAFSSFYLKNVPFDPIFSSDHDPIVCSMLIGKKTFRELSNALIYNYRLLDIDRMNSCLEALNWSAVYQASSVNDAFEIFIDIVVSLIRDHTPSFIPRGKKLRHYPWVDHEIILLYRIKKSTHLISRSNNSCLSRVLFEETREHCRKLFDIKRRKYFLDLEGDIGRGDLGPFWKFIKSTKDVPSFPHEMRYLSQVAISDIDKAELFSKFFSCSYNSNNYVYPYVESLELPTIVLPIYDEDDVLSVIDLLKDDLSPSPDDICSRVVKSISHNVIVVFTYLINLSISQGVFPRCLKLALVLPKFKVGDQSDISNYRPISILSIFSKIIEKLVVNSLSFNFRSILTDSQHGFVSGRSTATNLAEYNFHISNALEAQKQLDSIYTDLAKAFDYVNHDLLIYKLRSLGFSEGLLHFIRSFLSDRSFTVGVNGTKSSAALIISGVIQGSTLGPLLFNLFINDLPSCLTVSSLLYADDAKFFKSIDSYCDHLDLQANIDKFWSWCLTWGLKINLEKCAIISFTRKKSTSIFNYHIDDYVLKRVSNVRDLGVLYDSDFTFSRHISDLVLTASRSLGYVKFMARHFNSFLAIKSLFESIIRSRLEYCSVIWNDCTDSDASDIERIQSRFLRFLTYKMRVNFRNLSYEELCCLFRFRSLKYRRDQADLNFLFNVSNARFSSSLLLSCVKLNVPRANSRSMLIFFIGHSYTRYFNKCVMHRAMNICNINQISVFVNFSLFLKDCKSKLLVDYNDL